MNNQDLQDINTLCIAIEDAIDSISMLEQLPQPTDSYSSKLQFIAIESMANRLGMPVSNISLSTESISEIITTIIEKVKAAFSYLVDKIKSLFGGSSSEKMNPESLTKLLEKINVILKDSEFQSRLENKNDKTFPEYLTPLCSNALYNGNLYLSNAVELINNYKDILTLFNEASEVLSSAITDGEFIKAVHAFAHSWNPKIEKLLNGKKEFIVMDNKLLKFESELSERGFLAFKIKTVSGDKLPENLIFKGDHSQIHTLTSSIKDLSDVFKKTAKSIPDDVNKSRNKFIKELEDKKRKDSDDKENLGSAIFILKFSLEVFNSQLFYLTHSEKLVEKVEQMIKFLNKDSAE